MRERRQELGLAGSPERRAQHEGLPAGGHGVVDEERPPHLLLGLDVGTGGEHRRGGACRRPGRGRTRADGVRRPRRSRPSSARRTAIRQARSRSVARSAAACRTDQCSSVEATPRACAGPAWRASGTSTSPTTASASAASRPGTRRPAPSGRRPGAPGSGRARRAPGWSPSTRARVSALDTSRAGDVAEQQHAGRRWRPRAPGRAGRRQLAGRARAAAAARPGRADGGEGVGRRR